MEIMVEKFREMKHKIKSLLYWITGNNYRKRGKEETENRRKKIVN